MIPEGQKKPKLSDVLKIDDRIQPGQIAPRFDWRKMIHAPRSYREYKMAAEALGQTPISEERFDELMKDKT